MANVERIQYDTKDLQGNDIRVVYEKFQGEAPIGVSPEGIYSIMHYWIGGLRLDVVFSTAKSAKEAYGALQQVRTINVIVDEEQPKVKVSEEGA